jgi:hypothetical protein
MLDRKRPTRRGNEERRLCQPPLSAPLLLQSFPPFLSFLLSFLSSRLFLIFMHFSLVLLRCLRFIETYSRVLQRGLRRKEGGSSPRGGGKEGR